LTSVEAKQHGIATLMNMLSHMTLRSTFAVVGHMARSGEG
jgi:hypothetical protein